MQPKKRMKMCPYCEGQVEITAAICPFCGTEIGHVGENDAAGKDVRSLSPQETLASLYPPPYRAKSEELSQPKNPAPFPRETLREEEIFEESKEQEGKAIPESIFLPLFLFSLGINLLLLSFFLFFFSSNGEVMLHWKGYWWVVYFLIGLPLIIFGYKKLSQQDL